MMASNKIVLNCYYQQPIIGNNRSYENVLAFGRHIRYSMGKSYFWVNFNDKWKNRNSLRFILDEVPFAALKELVKNYQRMGQAVQPKNLCHFGWFVSVPIFKTSNSFREPQFRTKFVTHRITTGWEWILAAVNIQKVFTHEIIPIIWLALAVSSKTFSQSHDFCYHLGLFSSISISHHCMSLSCFINFTGSFPKIFHLEELP